MSSSRWAEAVAEFHRARGNEPPVNITGRIVPEVALLRLRLMASELGELADAMHEKDIVEIADGLCDLLYVTVGTALEYGLGPILHDLFEEVHSSNMTKRHGGAGAAAKYGPGGGKGEGFKPPRIAEILDDYIDTVKKINEFEQLK